MQPIPSNIVSDHPLDTVTIPFTVCVETGTVVVVEVLVVEVLVVVDLVDVALVVLELVAAKESRILLATILSSLATI